MSEGLPFNPEEKRAEVIFQIPFLQLKNLQGFSYIYTLAVDSVHERERKFICFVKKAISKNVY